MILAIDTSTDICSVSVIENEKQKSKNILNTKQLHAEKLILIINQTLENINITLKDIKEAISKGERIKLIAIAEKKNGDFIAEVMPKSIPLYDPLANVMGVMNAINFKTDCLGDITIIGPGAGRRATGYAIISDMISIVMNRR